jgi:hypothetical protein
VAHICAPTFASGASSNVRTTNYLRQTRTMNRISVMTRQINMAFCLLTAFLYRSRGQSTFAILTASFTLSLLTKLPRQFVN